LRLLEAAYRDGEPLPPAFTQRLREAVASGNLEVLAAYIGGRTVGVLVVAFRPGITLGGVFASIEELYVEPEERGRGVGRALVEAAAERCLTRGVSYVEVQTDDEAEGFYLKLGYEPEPDVRVLSRSYVVGRPDPE
jgi:GNAT superfamily N-acetyltransferase